MGFFQVPNEVFYLPCTAYELLVYINILRRSNNGSEAFPSYTRIAIDCHMSRRSAIRAIRGLEAHGLLTKSSEHMQTNHYKLVTTGHHPSDTQSLPLVSDSHPKNNHINNNHLKIKDNDNLNSTGDNKVIPREWF